MKCSTKKVIITSAIMLSIIYSMTASAETFTGIGAIGGFKEWAQHLINVFNEFKEFIQIVCTLVGMWFFLLGLLLFRKHHTAQGMQGDHIKNGTGHLIAGVFLICIVPGIQMLQSSMIQGAGSENARTHSVFNLDYNALDN